MVSLTFGFSTLANRLSNISLPDLSNHPDWDVLITVQSGNEQSPTEAELAKAPTGKNVEMLSFPGVGVTKLRNHVIKNAKGKYLIFSDDDIVFDEKGLVEAISYLEKTGAGLLLGQAVDENGKLRKAYPSNVQRLNKFNSAKAATYEMIVDLAQVRAAGVLFDENFGAGAEKTYLGDEYIFICDLVSAGIRCDFVPIVLASHPTESSGSGWGTDRDRIARALIFDRAFKGNRTLPFMARVAFGLRKIGKGLTLGTYMRFIFKR
jgi:glycosyltransferase involved in cell wall biosynthesis